MSSTPAASALRRARSTVLGPSTDVAALQTAAALEATAILTYQALVTLPFIATGDASLLSALDAARDHHAAHAAAFNAAAVAAGGAPQPLPEPSLLATVRARLPAVSVPRDVLAVALLVEETLAATHIVRAPTASTPPLRAQYVATAAVESQHVAYLRTAAAAGVGTASDPLATRLALATTSGSSVTPRRHTVSDPVVAAAVGSAGCTAAFAPQAGAVAPDAGAVS